MENKKKVRIFFPVDVPSLEKGRPLLEIVAPYVDVGKVGLELMHNVGTPDAIALPKEFGLDVMVDAKLIDIPPTVEGGIEGIIRHGVSYVNVMAVGGKKMIASAVERVRKISRELDIPRPKVIAVTVLTSLDFNDLIQLGIKPSQSWIVENLQWKSFGPKKYATLEKQGFNLFNNDEKQKFITQIVLDWAGMAINEGVDVVLTSPMEAAAINQRFPSIELICPGIRPPWSPPDHQNRKLSPYEAVLAGVYNQVIGTPIRKPPEGMTVKEAVKRIRADIDMALSKLNANMASSI